MHTAYAPSSEATSPFPRFFRANLDRKRQIWPAAWCGLHYVRPFPLIYYAIKIAISAAVIVAVSEVAKRNSSVAALVAALPLTSLLAFIWLHVEGSSSAAIGELSTQVFWLVLPSLVLFLVFPVLLKFGINFWLSLGVSCAATIVCYWIMAPFLRKAGVQL